MFETKNQQCVESSDIYENTLNGINELTKELEDLNKQEYNRINENAEKGLTLFCSTETDECYTAKKGKKETDGAPGGERTYGYVRDQVRSKALEAYRKRFTDQYVAEAITDLETQILRQLLGENLLNKIEKNSGKIANDRNILTEKEQDLLLTAQNKLGGAFFKASNGYDETQLTEFLTSKTQVDPKTPKGFIKLTLTNSGEGSPSNGIVREMGDYEYGDSNYERGLLLLYLKELINLKREISCERQITQAEKE
ncbi:hypothetical protein A2335_02165 [Candidatus Peregrinibacteria bacterium RIFOXYB2_FULL_32_7]|nr:MAG: hypothetical protein A2335_02165 [Candidatus Peregrinibacteria bacterium RIFOXYB2_FULL_32_7]